MKKISLAGQIVIGLILGILWALASAYFGFSKFTMDWIAPFGQIFINLLKLIAVPLVLFSIIKGISDLSDASRLGRLGIKTLGFYLMTTVASVTIGLVLVNLIQPGKFISEDQRLNNRRNYELYVVKNGLEVKDGNRVFTDEQLQQADTTLILTQDDFVTSKMAQASEVKDDGPLQFIVDMVPSNIFLSLNDNSLMLQVIFFAIFFGLTLLLIPNDKAKPVTNLIEGLNEAFMKMVSITMRGAPFFVFALLAGKITELAADKNGVVDPGNIIEIFKGLASYSVNVVIGLFMLVLIYPLVVRLFTGRSYGSFAKGISPAQTLAFSTSSSVATLPLTIECVRHRLGVSKEITSFVLPIGATVNMDGTSLYQAVAVVFLAQFHMVDLTIGQQLVIILTATLASIGSAAVPSAGLIMMIIVLQSVGLDPSWFAIVVPVDRILDMCRTVVNVTGDATVATLVAHSEGELTNPTETPEAAA